MNYNFNNQLLHYGRHFIDNSDIKEVIKVLKSNNLTQGNTIINFEKKLSRKFGSKYAAVLSNGTAALYLVGRVLNWSSKDIIITSPITFLATANSIVYNGAQPDLCDINLYNYTIDVNRLEDKIKNHIKNNRKVKSIIGVDYAGHPCDWKNLKFLSKKYNISLINDCCHALGAKIDGNEKYAIKYADIVTHSYHPVKHMTTGEGGAVLTNNKIIDKKIKLLRSHSMIRNNETKKKGLWNYRMTEIGYNYRITDFQCALGINQLKKLEKFTKERNKSAKFYDKLFKNNEIFQVPKINSNISHAYHLYPLLINFEKVSISKKLMFERALRKKIKLQVHYIPIYLQKFYKDKYEFKINNFPNSNIFYSREVSIPIFYKITKEQQIYVKDTLYKLLKL